jgi:hypothetical protein
MLDQAELLYFGFGARFEADMPKKRAGSIFSRALAILESIFCNSYLEGLEFCFKRRVSARVGFEAGAANLILIRRNL